MCCLLRWWWLIIVIVAMLYHWGVLCCCCYMCCMCLCNLYVGCVCVDCVWVCSHGYEVCCVFVYGCLWDWLFDVCVGYMLVCGVMCPLLYYCIGNALFYMCVCDQCMSVCCCDCAYVWYGFQYDDYCPPMFVVMSNSGLMVCVVWLGLLC